MKWKRSKRGQGITELAFGFLILIPILLLFYDLGVFALSKQTLDYQVKDVARAAANQATVEEAHAAVDKILNRFKPSPYITAMTKKSLTWDVTNPKGERVTVVLEMKGKLPVPLPGLSNDWTFTQGQTESIVGIPVPR